MSLVDDFRLIRWMETLWYNALRSLAAALVWTVLLFMNDDGRMAAQYGGQASLMWLAMPFMLSAVLIPATLIFRVLAYIPLAGIIFALLAIVMLGVGDPFVFALHKVKPEWVPIERPPFFSIAGFYIVTSPYKEF
jgi:hypothetical protein